MEPAQTAAAVVAILAAKSGVEAVGTEMGRDTWRCVTRVIELIRTRFQDDTDADLALEAIMTDGDHTDADTVLAGHLRRYLMTDADFRRELETLVAQVGSRVNQPGGLTISADTVKAVFTDRVEIHGDFTIS